MKLLIFLVSIIIFSVIGIEEGFADADFTVIASTDKDVYEFGDTVKISGHVENYDSALGNEMFYTVYYTSRAHPVSGCASGNCNPGYVRRQYDRGRSTPNPNPRNGSGFRGLHVDCTRRYVR